MSRISFEERYSTCAEKSRNKGQLFLGFVGNGRVIGKTKCKLYCKKSRIYWETTSVEKHLRRDGCSCKVCARDRVTEKTRIPYEKLIQKISDSCEYFGSEFRGLVEDKGIFSMVVQYCPKHNITWDTTCAKTLIDRTNKGSGCPLCRHENQKKASDKRDTQIITSLISSGNFIEGTEFWRSERTTKEGSRNFWKYTCPVCSNDEYVKAGLCSGII